MTDEQLASILARLEEEPPIRPAFAEALRARLGEELGFGEAPADHADGDVVAEPATATGTRASPEGDRRSAHRSGRRWWPARPPIRPLTLRTVLAALALVLLLATMALAAGLLLRGWLSSGPGGPQFTDDFAFREVYRESGAFYDDLRIAPDGRTLLALRVPVPWPDREPAEGAVVRFDPTGDGRIAPVVVVPFERLRDPALWDTGTDLASATFSQSIGGGAGFDTLSVAPNGDTFIAASARPQGLDGPLGPSSIVVVRANGTVGKVVTSGELLASGLFDRLDEVIGMTAVASAPDLLWARVDGPVAEPLGTASWLFQVVDPDADGDWSDRVIRPLTLPPSVPPVEYGVYERVYGSMVAEPSLEGRDRSRSILLPVLEDHGEFTIHRLTDSDGDADFGDQGEAELVFETFTSARMDVPAIAPRVVIDDGRPVVDEMVAGGISRASRISRITEDGLVDVVRALPSYTNAVVADAGGALYFTAQEPGSADDPPVDVLFRLEPVPVGAEAPDAARLGPSAAAASPDPSFGPLFDPGPVTDGVPSVAFTASDGVRTEALRVGVDGSGPSRVVDGDLVWSFCQSADASRVGYRAVTDVPNEPRVFVADRDGSHPELVSETVDAWWCGFPPDAMLFGTGQWVDDQHQSVIRHDLASGVESVLAEDVAVLQISPDGSRLAVSDDPARSALAVVDVATGARTEVATAADQVVRAAWWSPDGTALAYVVADTPVVDPATETELGLRVTAADGGPLRELLTFRGREPAVSWSADGARLLLRAPTSHSDAFVLDTPEGSLWLVDIASGERRAVLDDGVRWAAWSPTDPGTFAYATSDALYLAAPDGTETRLLERPSEALCEACWDEGPWQVGHWLGWSPDGRYVGLGRYSGAIAVVDTTSGELLVPLASVEGRRIDEPRWWR